jgi:hypothetical protein
MSFNTHLYSIILALLAAVVPAIFNLADSNLWSYIQILGILFTPGLSFSLFLRRWGKNVSDDIAFALSILISLAWIMFFVSWNSIRGEQFETDTLLFSVLGAVAIFMALGALPNGRELTPSEPVKYKIPLAISLTLVIIFGSIAYYLADTDKLSISPNESVSDIISVAGRNGDNITLRVYNPKDSLIRTTLYFEDIENKTVAEIFTDILGSGENYLTIKLPATSSEECRKYKLIYATSSSEGAYYDDIFLVSSGCYSPDSESPKDALPTEREALLDYIYESSLE